MKKYITYFHHNKYMFVRNDLKDKHWQYCLCIECENFKPEDRENNCVTANTLYGLCKLASIVTPVWQCEKFKEKQE